MTVTDPFATTTSTEAPPVTSSDTTTPEGGRSANARYSAAQALLRAAHQSEFQMLLEAEYAKDGLEYRKRLTAEERAAQEQERKREAAAAKIAAIREQFPDLEV